jgi:hypothetical protein
MSAVEEDDVTVTVTAPDAKSVDSMWNLNGLKKEVSRLTVRCHKKVGKAHQRLQTATKEVERLTSSGPDDVTLEELEQCPNLEGLEADVQELQNRLTQLNQLEVLLQDFKGKKILLPEHIAALALELQVQDEPPQQAERPAKKEKGPRNMNSFRLPYRRYYTANKTEIRVRKQSATMMMMMMMIEVVGMNINRLGNRAHTNFVFLSPTGWQTGRRQRSIVFVPGTSR